MKAFLARDYGMDPSVQNLFDGSLKSPTVRSMLGYSSVERRLERAIVRELLRCPESNSVVLDSARLFRVLGSGWRDSIVGLGDSGMSRVSLLVCESCVRVRVSLRGSDVVASVY